MLWRFTFVFCCIGWLNNNLLQSADLIELLIPFQQLLGGQAHHAIFIGHRKIHFYLEIVWLRYS